MPHPLEAVLIGAGQRGADAYAPYALRHPEEIRFVAVAEPDQAARQRFAAAHHIPPARQFTTWEDLLDLPQLGEAALVCTQDWLHTAPALAALRSGYHVLLEKPMATRREECIQLVQASEETGRQLHICHVLRYTKHCRTIREIIQSGALGDVMDVDHRENVGYWHMAHSFVRGNWRNSQTSSPMILAKCCHDFDILLWWLGGHCQKLSSIGELTHFRPENAPAGAPLRCTDGCPASQTCLYYAPWFYIGLTPFWRSFVELASGFPRWAVGAYLKSPGLVRALAAVLPSLRQVTNFRRWPLTVLTPNPTPQNLLEALRTGPYGRCVYHCDNNVVDHQVVSMQFEGGQSVSLAMHGFSHTEYRTTRIEGTRGRLLAELGSGGSWVSVDDHRSDRHTLYNTSGPPESGHGGGDDEMMAGFVRSIREGGTALTTARQSLESHLMAFAAERARLEGRMVTADEF